MSSRSPFLSLRHRLTVFFASQMVHSSENRMGKTGMAVANGSYFIVWENGVGIEFFD
jgi:hypothetical protein